MEASRLTAYRRKGVPKWEASGAENPCLQPNDPACSSATLESGVGEVRILFDEQRVEAAADSSIPALATKGGATTPLFLVSAYEEGADCMTSQPGDLFSEVECVPYWNDSFIQAEVVKWFRKEPQRHDITRL